VKGYVLGCLRKQKWRSVYVGGRHKKWARLICVPLEGEQVAPSRRGARDVFTANDAASGQIDRSDTRGEYDGPEGVSWQQEGAALLSLAARSTREGRRRRPRPGHGNADGTSVWTKSREAQPVGVGWLDVGRRPPGDTAPSFQGGLHRQKRTIRSNGSGVNDTTSLDRMRNLHKSSAEAEQERGPFCVMPQQTI